MPDDTPPLPPVITHDLFPADSITTRQREAMRETRWFKAFTRFVDVLSEATDAEQHATIKWLAERFNVKL